MACYNCNLCKYALGAPIVGTASVVYTIKTTLCKLKRQDLFLIFVPASTTSTLPPVLQLCDGSLLPVVYSGTDAAAEASGLPGNLGGRFTRGLFTPFGCLPPAAFRGGTASRVSSISHTFSPFPGLWPRGRPDSR